MNKKLFASYGTRRLIIGSARARICSLFELGSLGPYPQDTFPPVHTMITFAGLELHLNSFMTSEICGIEFSASRLWLFCYRGKWTLCSWRRFGPQSRYGCFWDKKNLVPLLKIESESSVVHPRALPLFRICYTGFRTLQLSSLRFFITILSYSRFFQIFLTICIFNYNILFIFLLLFACYVHPSFDSRNDTWRRDILNSSLLSKFLLGPNIFTIDWYLTISVYSYGRQTEFCLHISEAQSCAVIGIYFRRGTKIEVYEVNGSVFWFLVLNFTMYIKLVGVTVKYILIKLTWF